jgi:hypothetical protein
MILLGAAIIWGLQSCLVVALRVAVETDLSCRIVSDMTDTTGGPILLERSIEELGVVRDWPHIPFPHVLLR